MLNLILIFAFYVFFLALIWPKPERGVYLTILLLPTYLIRFQLFNIPLTLLEGMVWLLFIIWLVKLYLNKRLSLAFTQWIKNKFKPEAEQVESTNYNLIPTALRWPMILFLISATLALILSPHFLPAAGIWKAYFLEPLMFLMVFIFYIKKESSLNKTITSLAVLSLIIGSYALIQKLTGWNIPNIDWYLPETRRITTFFGYPNANGLLLAPIGVLLFSSLWLKEKVWLKIINTLGFITSILTIVWARSEGALIALAVGVFIILLTKKKTSLIAVVLLLVSIGAVLLNPGLKTTVWEKITISDFSGQIRQSQWSETLDMLTDKPLMGGGLANYQNAITPYHRSGLTINKQWQPLEIFLYPHNFFLNFWTELGLLGLIAILWLLIAIGILIYRLNKKKKWLPKYKKKYISNLSLGLTAVFVTIIIHGLVDVPYFKNDLSILFWVFVGMVIVLYNHTINKKIAQLE